MAVWKIKIYFCLFTASLLLSMVLPTIHGQEEVWPAHMIGRFDDYEKAMEQYKAEKKFEEREQRYRADIFLMRILKAGADHPGILDSLEMTPAQSAELKGLISAYKEKEAELRERFAGRNDIEKLVNKKMISINHELTSKACDILVTVQLDDLIHMNILKTGVPRLLVDTKMGDALGLSTAQKARIKANSDRVARKVEKFMHEVRQEAVDAVYSELDQGNKQMLAKIYGEKIVKSYFENLGVPSIFAHFRFLTEKDIEENPRPSVLRSDLPDFQNE